MKSERVPYDAYPTRSSDVSRSCTSPTFIMGANFLQSTNFAYDETNKNVVPLRILEDVVLFPSHGSLMYVSSVR